MRSHGPSGPLKLHLSLLIILLLVGIAGPLIWLSHQRGQAAAIADANRQMTALSERTMDRYRLLFADAVPILNVLAAADAIAKVSPETLTARRDMLVAALADASHLDGIYCAYPDGSFVHLVRLEDGGAWRKTLAAPAEALFAFRVIEAVGAGNRVSRWQFLNQAGQAIAAAAPSEADYDPRARPWYKLASAVPGIVADGPYVTATTKSLAVTIAKSHALDGRIVIGTDIGLDTIAEFLAQEKVSPGSAAFVLDAQGNAVIRSTGAGPPSPEDARLLEVVKKAEAGSEARIETVGGGTASPEKYLVSASRIAFSPLLQGNVLAIAAPLRDFTAESERLLAQGVGLSLALLLAGIASAIAVSRFITRSLSKLTADAVKLGDLETRTTPSSPSYVTEINLLSDALAVARDAIRNFALYVPRELVRKIVANKGTVTLGERLDVTVLFTDIRDFTTISENNPPEDVVSWLSSYFDLMNETVEENHGTIIQFLGDSIYAMWNAPLSDPSHVDHACLCALKLARRLEIFNESQRAAGKPVLVTRFGLHTGPAVVGNVGARNRLQYTAMGDTVNVASRLEGINKAFGTTILASRAARDHAQAGFVFRPLGFHQAKGREEKVEIFELVAVCEPQD